MLCDVRRRSRARGDEPPEARGGGAGPPLRRRVALPDRGVLVGGRRARAAAGAPLRLARRGPLAPAAAPAAAAARAARRPPRRRLPGRPPRARAREPGGGRARDRAAAPRRAVPLGGRRLGPARAGGARRRPPLRLLARDRARGRVGSAPTLAPADAAPRARDQPSGAPGVRTTGAPRCAPRLRHLAWESRLERPTILFVGRAADPRKNVAALLEAFRLLRARLPAARLRLVGEPPGLALPEGAEAVGPVPDVAAELARATVLVLPSLQEGFGIVVAEALAAGVPVVVTPCGGPEELVRGSGGGVVAEGFGAEAVAAALSELLQDPGRLLAARRSGRRHVEREHSSARFRDLLARALARLEAEVA